MKNIEMVMNRDIELLLDVVSLFCWSFDCFSFKNVRIKDDPEEGVLRYFQVYNLIDVEIEKSYGISVMFCDLFHNLWNY